MRCTKNFGILGAVIAAALLVTFLPNAQAATAPLTFNVGSGSSFSGALRGNLTLSLISGSGQVSVSVTSDLGFFGDLTGDGVLNMNVPGGQTVGMNIAESANQFDVTPTGSFTIDATDDRQDAVGGVLDNGAPGSDGRWDMTDSAFEATTLRDMSLSVPNIIGNITPSGDTITGTVDGDIDVSFLTVDVNGDLGISISSIQNAGLTGVTANQNADSGFSPTPISNFGDGNHVLGDFLPDLSTTAIVGPDTNIGGTIGADFFGDVSGDVQGSVLGIDFDIVDGVLVNDFSIGNLSETLNLDEVLPGILDILHSDTTNVDFDDVSAELNAGTFGLFLPIPVELDPMTIPFSTSIGPETDGDITIAANLAGEFTLQIDGVIEVMLDATLQGDTIANSVNVIPEPGSVILFGLAAFGIAPLAWRRWNRRR